MEAQNAPEGVWKNPLDEITSMSRKKLGVKNCNEFVELVAMKTGTGIAEAKELIKHNSRLMAMMFWIA
jgi:hypothetical protein